MIKALFRLPLLTLCFLLATSSPAVARTVYFDIVFDLDWTLFYPVEKYVDGQTIHLPDGYFRMADGVPQVLLNLHRQGHRISLFSGGPSTRNNALAEVIKRKIHERGGTDFSFYKILNFEDLSPRLNASPDARFPDRWMKDLKKVNADLSYVLLVDDIAKFSFPGQEKNIYWLKKTFEFFPKYEQRATGPFDPPTEKAWRAERNKITQFFDNFQMARKYYSNDEVLPVLQDLSQSKSLCPRAF